MQNSRRIKSKVTSLIFLKDYFQLDSKLFRIFESGSNDINNFFIITVYKNCCIFKFY